jgi:hypothetical protein
MLDLVTLRLEQLDEEGATRVLPLARRNAVGDRDDRRLQTASFVFSTSVTSETTMPLSIALAMS